ncbi:START domain-containing protein [Aquimarina sp. AU474]|uniref:START domain-containing protein n=1 Tax=Aquimarina sp. AU474 TaxID=2108529 RepID=UPI000D69A108|nr:START domain-containing protein [Aquimarina sp. AU474]
MKTIYYLLLLVPVLGYNQSNWKLAKNQRDIEIWVRDYKDSPYKEYKATTIIKTSLESVVQELLEAPEYMQNCKEGISHLVKVNDAQEYIFYVRNEFPWPIKNRDVVSKLNVQKISDNKVKLFINAVPNEIPELEKTLRIQELSGYWLLEQEGGTVKITQQLYINPEGTLPPFVTNSLLVTGPFRTFTSLKHTLENVNS